MIFYLVLGGIGCWPFIARYFYPQTFSWKEVFSQVAIAWVLAVAGWQIGVYNRAAFVEVWNGEITGKTRDIVSCTHSYPCRCRDVCSGSGKDRSCSTQCDTCYDHPFDVDWDVHTNVGGFTVPRIDSQGLLEPPRWTNVLKGEPASREHSYQNYVRAREESLFHKRMEEMAGLPPVPPYPRVFDYYRIQRVLGVGVTIPEQPLWDADVSDALKVLGPTKQANILLLIVATPDRQYRYKVEAAWQGGNKNDVTVLLGVSPEDRKILWADVITFADNKDNDALQVQLRNALLDVGTADRTKVLPVVFDHVKRLYSRPHMKDFEYLKNDMDPSLWYQIFFVITQILISFGLTVFFRMYDVSFSGIVRQADSTFRGMRRRNF